MAKRFNILKHEKDVYILNNCPVTMSGHAITKDTKLNKVFAQCKFENLGNKTIIAFFVKVSCYGIDGDDLSNTDNFSHLDLNINQYEEFGEKTAIPIEDKNTRRITVIPKKIVFSDKSVWINELMDEFIPLEMNLKDIDSLGELSTQYRRDLEKYVNIYKISLHKTLICKGDEFTTCGCGKIILNNEEICPVCGANIEGLEKLKNKDILKENLTKYKDMLKEISKEKLIKQQNEEKKRKRNFKVVIIFVILGIIIYTGNLVNKHLIIPSNMYNQALNFEENEEYAKALEIYEDLGDYKDSNNRILNAKYNQALNFEENEEYTNAIKLYKDLLDYKESNDRKNELLTSFKEKIILNQSITLSAGNRFIVGLKHNGTPIAVGNNRNGQTEVENWKDIVAVSAGSHNTVGLKKDGKVVTVGDNSKGQLKVENWKDIVAISAGGYHTVGLKKDSTVVAVGYNSDGRLKVENWKDIVAISAGFFHTVGLKKDGTVVAVGINREDQLEVENWKDIIAISAGNNYTVGLKTDGTVELAGSPLVNKDSINWENIGNN